MAKKKSAKAGAKKPAAKKSAAKSVAKKSVAKKAAPKAKSASKAAPKAKSAAKPAAKGSGKVSALKSAGKKVGKVAKKVVKALKPITNNVVPFARPSKSTAKNSANELASIFSPLDDRLIVEIEGAATRTSGGLYIPDTVEISDRPQQGKVLAVGRGHRDKKGRLRPLDVQLGDMVLFERYLGSELNIGDRKLFVLRESQVLGIVKS